MRKVFIFLVCAWLAVFAASRVFSFGGGGGGGGGSSNAANGIINVTDAAYGAKADGVELFDAAIPNSAAHASSTTPAAPAITTYAANDVLMTIIGEDGNALTAPPAAPTPRAQATATGSNCGVWLGDQPVPTATTVAAQTGTIAGSPKWGAFSIALAPTAGQTISFINGTNNKGSGASLVLTVPTHVDGDTMFAVLATTSGYINTAGIPAGWSWVGIADNTGGNERTYVYYRKASSEPANYTWTCQATCFPGGLIVDYRNVAGMDVLLTSATASFTASDVGKLICATGIGPSLNTLAQQTYLGQRCGVIISRQSATSISTSILNGTGTDVTGSTFSYATDSTTAIQAAITALATTGGEVYFPKGNYGLTAGLTIPINSAINLAGAGASLYRYTFSPPQGPVTPTGTQLWFLTQTMATAGITYSGSGAVENFAPTIVMSDMTLWGGTGINWDGAGGDGVDIYGLQSLEITRMVIGNFTGDGVLLSALNGSTWNNNDVIKQSYIFYNGGNGVNITGSNLAQTNEQLDGNQIFANGKSGVINTSSVLAALTIHDNTIAGNERLLVGACEVSGGGFGMVLMGNYIQPNSVAGDYGYCVLTGTSASLIGNYWFGTTEAWNLGTNATTTVSKANISGNYIKVGSAACAHNVFIDTTITGKGSNKCVTTFGGATTMADPLIQTFAGSSTTAIPAATVDNTGTRACVTDGLTACTASSTYAAAAGAASCQVQSTGTAWKYTGAVCFAGEPG